MLKQGNSLIFFVLFGCTTPSPPNIEPIPTADVVNSVKCGLALALFKEQTSSTPKRLTGNVASLELQLKTTVGQSQGGSIAGVIPFQGGPKILPTFSASRATAWTVDSLVEASYRLDATNTEVCRLSGINNLADSNHDPLGFSKWLSLTIEDLGKVSLEKPSGTLDSLSYEAAFGVIENSSGSVSLQLAFVTADVNAANNRNDLQRIKVTISPAPATSEAAPVQGTKSKKSPDDKLGPLSNGGVIRNFSSSIPAVR